MTLYIYLSTFKYPDMMKNTVIEFLSINKCLPKDLFFPLCDRDSYSTSN